MPHYYQIILVKKAENTVNVAAHLNPDFINPFCILQMLEIDFRNSVQGFYDLQRPQNLLLNFPGQAVVKFSETQITNAILQCP